MRNRDNRFTIYVAAAAAICSSQLRAQSFNSPQDLVLLQTNGDGNIYSNNSITYGGDSVTLLDLSIAASGASTGSPLSVSVANSLTLPTNSLTYNGSAVGLVLPDSGSHPGQISLSQDGHSLTLGTYLAPVGAVNYYGTQTAPNNVTPDIAPRVITEVSSSGNVTEPAILSGPSDYSAVDIRQVTSLSGTQFWSVGNGVKPPSETDSGGLRYSVSGSTSTSSLNIQDDIDARTTVIYQGQMYVAGGSDNNPTGIHTLSQLGTGLNTTPQNWKPSQSIVPPSTNPVSILGDQSPCFLTLNNGASVLYESDSTTGALEKWSLINGVWNFDGKIAYGKDNIENIAARLNSDGSVSLFTDNDEGNSGGGYLYGYVDTGGAGLLNVSNQTYTLSGGNRVYVPNTPIYSGITTGNNSDPITQKFWGLSFAPSASAAVADQIWGNLDGVTGAAGGSWGNAGNWAAGSNANASGSTATFGPGLTSNASGGIITLDGSKTVGHVEFNDSAVNYDLTPGSGGTLTIDNTAQYSSGVPSIFNSAGSQTIAVPINLAAGVTIANHFNSSIAITSAITGSGSVQVYGPGSLTLSGTSTYSGATVVHSGSVLITAAGQLPVTTDLSVGDTSDIAAVGTTALLTYNASTGTSIRPINLNSLTVHANGTVDLVKPVAVASRSVVVLNGLTFDGSTTGWSGQLDLSGNDMIIHGGSLANVTSQVAAGYNFGRWNGGSGIVSSVAAADSTHLTALGVIQNNQSGTAIYTASKKFDNVAPNASDILVKYTYYGDTDLSGTVDGLDYSRIDAAYLADQKNPNAYTGWLNGDFNYDGAIDGSDYTLIDDAFNTQGAPLADQIAAADAIPTSQISEISAVPEPGSFGLVALLSIGARRRRSRSNCQKDGHC